LFQIHEGEEDAVVSSLFVARRGANYAAVRLYCGHYLAKIGRSAQLHGREGTAIRLWCARACVGVFNTEARGEGRDARCEMQDARGTRREARGKRREKRCERREARGKRQETRDKRQEIRDKRGDLKNPVDPVYFDVVRVESEWEAMRSLPGGEGGAES
jgi:hypothetical protein